jgi:hypothetical protein
VPSTFTAARLCSALPPGGAAANNVSDRISRDDATEIVGRAKFGDAWVGPATDEEFKLKKEYRRRLKGRLPISEELVKTRRPNFSFVMAGRWSMY